MADSSFTNFFNNSNSFGLTVKAHEKTLQQIGQTAGGVAGGVFEPLFTYLEENENVFSGDISKELNRLRSESFTTNLVLDSMDARVNGPKASFDTKF